MDYTIVFMQFSCGFKGNYSEILSREREKGAMLRSLSALNTYLLGKKKSSPAS
jgi:hypothetical protein